MPSILPDNNQATDDDVSRVASIVLHDSIACLKAILDDDGIPLTRDAVDRGVKAALARGCHARLSLLVDKSLAIDLSPDLFGEWVHEAATTHKQLALAIYLQQTLLLRPPRKKMLDEMVTTDEMMGGGRRWTGASRTAAMRGLAHHLLQNL
ncbi:Aste57867_25012 [Aphanomyces stellatus]|uniref:Aste57867_25012 protein n=1 Tax=Aphanomyces stellatus TaxID=120398 RepID=A0A485LS14_9STRA|nr:hypothetical protein As57867_024934 [Aphanomyces stellatus]VFU01643.1 Aste57867_25012 [Aphanomyces stellatus]